MHGFGIHRFADKARVYEGFFGVGPKSRSKLCTATRQRMPAHTCMPAPLRARWADGTFTLMVDAVEGFAHGEGVLRDRDGAVYEGEFASNLRHGQGKERFADGSHYEGEYKQGNMYGFGRKVETDGRIYGVCSPIIQSKGNMHRTH